MFNTSYSNVTNPQCRLLSLYTIVQTESQSCLFLLPVINRILEINTNKHFSMDQIIRTCWAVEAVILFVRASLRVLFPDFFTFMTRSFCSLLSTSANNLCTLYEGIVITLIYCIGLQQKDKYSYNILLKVTLITMTQLYFAKLQNDSGSSPQKHKVAHVPISGQEITGQILFINVVAHFIHPAIPFALHKLATQS